MLYIKNAMKNHIMISSFLYFALYKFNFFSRYTCVSLQNEKLFLKTRKKIIKNVVYTKRNDLLKGNNVWIYWDKGFENAPKAVLSCLNSVKKNISGLNIILLDDMNFSRYVKIDDRILELKRKKRLSIMAFSDILRLALLSKYGGLWVDSTCLFIKPIPNFIFDLDLFTFKSGYLNQGVPNFQSWFIYSKIHNPIIQETYRLLVELTIKFKGFPYYFFMFSVFQAVTEIYKEEWNNVPYVCDFNSYILQMNICKSSVENIQFLSEISFVQKVTYKNDFYEKNEKIFRLCQED